MKVECKIEDPVTVPIIGLKGSKVKAVAYSDILNTQFKQSIDLPCELIGTDTVTISFSDFGQHHSLFSQNFGYLDVLEEDGSRLRR